MLTQTLPPAPPAIVAPVAQGDRDSFPKCRASGGGGPVVYTCPKQSKTYALLLEKPDIDPEVGLVYTEWSTEITITAGYIPEQGGGEIARLTALVAADGWTITALIDTDNPEEEF